MLMLMVATWLLETLMLPVVGEVVVTFAVVNRIRFLGCFDALGGLDKKGCC